MGTLTGRVVTPLGPQFTVIPVAGVYLIPVTLFCFSEDAAAAG
jgi:hypothetical protein